uniref:Uncharacterized protein n=1 Tax=Heterorhabditis bacteriophora TaxID=37862 RepID=A0A1I7WHB8_HETBA
MRLVGMRILNIFTTRRITIVCSANVSDLAWYLFYRRGDDVIRLHLYKICFSITLYVKGTSKALWKLEIRKFLYRNHLIVFIIISRCFDVLYFLSSLDANFFSVYLRKEVDSSSSTSGRGNLAIFLLFQVVKIAISDKQFFNYIIICCISKDLPTFIKNRMNEV